jgi:hypothetical protein
MFKHSNRSIAQGDNENNNQQTTVDTVEKSHETEVSTGEYYQ